PAGRTATSSTSTPSTRSSTSRTTRTARRARTRCADTRSRRANSSGSSRRSSGRSRRSSTATPSHASISLAHEMHRVAEQPPASGAGVFQLRLPMNVFGSSRRPSRRRGVNADAQQDHAGPDELVPRGRREQQKDADRDAEPRKHVRAGQTLAVPPPQDEERRALSRNATP